MITVKSTYRHLFFYGQLLNVVNNIVPGADPAFWPRGLLDEIYITTRGGPGACSPGKFFKFEAL